MSTARQDALLDSLGQLAGRSEPAPLPPADAERMIQDVLDRATDATPAPRRPRWRARTALAVAAAILLAAAGGWLLRGPGAEQARGELPTGDRFVATSDAAFEIVSVAPEARRLAVRRGTVLFDVRPLSRGQVFEVRTPDLTVRVHGTVFSVEARDAESTVRVYEGTVEVIHRHVAERVGAGRMFRTERAMAEPLSPGPLAAQGTEAAARRSRGAAPPPAGGRAARSPIDVRQPGGGGSTGTADPQPSTTHDPTPPADEPASVSGPEATAATDGRPAQRGDTAAEVRALLRARRFDEALERARRGAAGDPALAVLAGDALRALGRPEEAADTYDAAAARLGGARGAEAGYLAARLRLTVLGDPSGALRSLDAAGVDSSALAERSLALRVRALLALDRQADAREMARRYLRRFPEGGVAEEMRDALAGSRSP